VVFADLWWCVSHGPSSTRWLYQAGSYQPKSRKLWALVAVQSWQPSAEELEAVGFGGSSKLAAISQTAGSCRLWWQFQAGSYQLESWKL